MQPATARLNGSVGDSLAGAFGLMLADIDPAARSFAQRDSNPALRQLDAEAALAELGDRLALELVALVDEGHTEGEADVAAEDLGVLGPGDHRARAHHRRDVAVHEGVAGEIRDAHHLVDDV